MVAIVVISSSVVYIYPCPPCQVYLSLRITFQPGVKCFIDTINFNEMEKGK